MAAIADYTEVIELTPHDANAYNDRGWSYYYHRNYEKAIADFDKKALREITPDDKQIYGKAAAAVATAARKFVEVHQDGSKLPEGIKIPTKAKGDPFVPKRQ